MADAPEGTPAGGGFFARKLGPLPMWAWMGLAVGALLAVTGLRRRSSGDESGVTQSYLPDTFDPTYVFQDQDRVFVTVPTAPPGTGRPPQTKPPTTKPPTTTPPTTTPPTTTPPAPPAGRFANIIEWRSGQPAGTPSTLWGMAEMVYGIGKGAQWQRIWDAPQNAALRAKRGAPEKVRAGDRFWVPT